MVGKILKKAKKKKFIKYGITSDYFFKTVNGKRDRYVKVVIRSKHSKTKVKQYKWRGGNRSLYEREARLPKGTKYYVNYNKNTIIKSPKFIEALQKKVTRRKKRLTIKKGKKVTKKEIFQDIRIIPKKVRHPPEPIDSKKIVDLLDGKIYYERRHNLNDFVSQQQENNFLLGILNRATKSKKYATNLLQNFPKIKNKMSYLIDVQGIDTTGVEQTVASFTVLGKRPKQIVDDLHTLNIKEGQVMEYGHKINYDLHQKGYKSVNINNGTYKITNVNLIVKFYNNPQKRLN